ncbi:hypothetical protein WA158_001382 [Blastocystis sp. Blastoise]
MNKEMQKVMPSPSSVNSINSDDSTSVQVKNDSMYLTVRAVKKPLYAITYDEWYRDKTRDGKEVLPPYTPNGVLHLYESSDAPEDRKGDLSFEDTTYVFTDDNDTPLMKIIPEVSDSSYYAIIRQPTMKNGGLVEQCEIHKINRLFTSKKIALGYHHDSDNIKINPEEGFEKNMIRNLPSSFKKMLTPVEQVPIADNDDFFDEPAITRGRGGSRRRDDDNDEKNEDTNDIMDEGLHYNEAADPVDIDKVYEGGDEDNVGDYVPSYSDDDSDVMAAKAANLDGDDVFSDNDDLDDDEKTSKDKVSAEKDDDDDDIDSVSSAVSKTSSFSSHKRPYEGDDIQSKRTDNDFIFTNPLGEKFDLRVIIKDIFKVHRGAIPYEGVLTAVIQTLQRKGIKKSWVNSHQLEVSKAIAQVASVDHYDNGIALYQIHSKTTF